MEDNDSAAWPSLSLVIGARRTARRWLDILDEAA
jgi:hypothetical protein